jgi:hypothetical protein
MLKQMSLAIVCAGMLAGAARADWTASGNPEFEWKLPGQSVWHSGSLPSITAARGQKISLTIRVTSQWSNIVGGRAVATEHRAIPNATVRWFGGKGIMPPNLNYDVPLDIRTTNSNGVATFSYTVPGNAIRGVRSDHWVQLLNWIAPNGRGYRGGQTAVAPLIIK